MRANDVEGLPFSWCYENACVDGAFQAQPLDILPAWPGGPVVFDLAEAGTVQEVDVFGATDFASVPLSDVATGEVPLGSWERILVTVGFGDSGSAAYAWRIGPVEP